MLDTSANLCFEQQELPKDGQKRGSSPTFALFSLFFEETDSESAQKTPQIVETRGDRLADAFEMEAAQCSGRQVELGQRASPATPTQALEKEGYLDTRITGSQQRPSKAHAKRESRPGKKSIEDMIDEPVDHDDEERGNMDDMRSTIFPKHNAHWIVMNPLLDWRLTWDILMMLLIVFVMIVTPFELAFINSLPLRDQFGPKYIGLWMCNMVVNFGFLVDICFNFFTAVYDDHSNSWILSVDKIVSNYVKSWFLLDIVSIVPIEYMAGSEAKVMRLLRLFRLFKLAKVLQSEKLVSRVSKHIDVSTKMQTIIKYCIFLLVLVHWSACALRLVTDYALTGCNVRSGDCPQTVLTTTGNWDDGVWAVYVEACLWALIALNGEAATQTHAEGVLGLYIMLSGVIILAFLVGDMSNIMSNLDPVANEFSQTLDNLNDYMAKSGFPNPLRLKLREYIMLSEPVYRDHFNKEMLSKLSPTLMAIVARQNLGRVVNRIPFYAYTIQRVHGYHKGVRVAVRPPPPIVGSEFNALVPAVRFGVITGSPVLLKYDVLYDDGTTEDRIKHTRLIAPESVDHRIKIYKLNYQRDFYVAKVAHLLTTQLFMVFDVIIHQNMSQNDVMYVVENGKVCLLNYDSRKQYGICVKQDNDFFGDDIAMLACGDHEKKVRQYSAHSMAITQLYSLDAMKFIELLKTEPALSLFEAHFRSWGCWLRLKRCFHGRPMSEIRAIAHGTPPPPSDGDRSPTLLVSPDDPALAEDPRRVRESMTTLAPADTAALLGLVSRAVARGLGPGDEAAASPLVLERLRDLVDALRAEKTP